MTTCSSSILVALSLTALSPACSNAQVVLQGDPATWEWQASLDNGQTWSAGAIITNQPSSSIRVRGVITFPGLEPLAYFGGILFDPYVDGLQGAGPSDTISAISRGQVPYTIQQLHVLRFGSRIKIDDDFDFLPPGQGTRWAQSFQGPNNGTSPTPVYLNPISVFEYTLNLDGTLGDRLVTAAWSTDTAFGYTPYMFSFIRTFQHMGEQWRHPMTESPLTIRVIPSPASASLLVLAGTLAARRRRRRVSPRSCAPKFLSVSGVVVERVPKRIGGPPHLEHGLPRCLIHPLAFAFAARSSWRTMEPVAR